MRPRLIFAAYWLALVVVSWLGMQAVHECGHVFAAWGSGGSVANVVLHPLAFSRTDVHPNPHPLVVLWAGPVFGAIVPWLVFLAFRNRAPDALRFFAGFCLLANGLYLALGPIDRIGDTGDLIARGAPLWSLVAMGVLFAAVGLYFWHHLDWRTRPSHKTVGGIVASFALLLVLGLGVGK